MSTGSNFTRRTIHLKKLNKLNDVCKLSVILEKTCSERERERERKCKGTGSVKCIGLLVHSTGVLVSSLRPAAWLRFPVVLLSALQLGWYLKIGCDRFLPKSLFIIILRVDFKQPLQSIQHCQINHERRTSLSNSKYYRFIYGSSIFNSRNGYVITG
jgi:hypothetical protein